MEKKHGFRLTGAKRKALELLSEYFCLTTNDIAGLMRGREPNENDKRTARLTMKLLREQGLVNRLPYFDVDQERGGITYVYGLSDKALQSREGKTFDEHSERTLDHELAISYFHISLKKFCEANGITLRWQQNHERINWHR